MSTVTEISESIQDGFFKAIEVGQRLTIEALSAASTTMDGVLPSTKLTDGMAGPQEAIDWSFKFADRLLDSQKAFLSELVTIVTPAPAPTTTAKKTTAS
jgi:hypothetical protein